MAGFTTMNKLIVSVITMAMMASSVAEAQIIPPCAEKLVGCANYLNTTTTPPATCCVPLNETITNELPCLCNLFDDLSLLKSLGINVTQAILLPARCNISFSTSECGGSPGPNSPVPNSPAQNSPPKNPAIAPSEPSSAFDTTRSSGMLSCLLILAAAMVY